VAKYQLRHLNLFTGSVSYSTSLISHVLRGINIKFLNLWNRRINSLNTLQEPQIAEIAVQEIHLKKHPSKVFLRMDMLILKYVLEFHIT